MTNNSYKVIAAGIEHRTQAPTMEEAIYDLFRLDGIEEVREIFGDMLDSDQKITIEENGNPVFEIFGVE